MVLFLLYIKAELENVATVKISRSSNLCIDVRNPLSDFEVREKVVLNPSEFVDQEENARESPYQFGLKWEGAKKVSTLTVLDEAATKTALKKKKNVEVKDAYTAEDSGSWCAILAVECRGIEPTAFFPMGEEFVVTSSGGQTFEEDMDFSEGDWADYDAENDEPVSLSDIQFKWEAI